MKKSIITFGIALFATVITSCGSARGVQSLETLAGNTWELSTLKGKNVNAADYAKGVPYINFATDNKVTGNGGCNGFGGSYNLNDEGGINLSQMMATKMYCKGSGENEFMDALSKANMTKIEKDKLTLLVGIEEVMTFVPKNKK